MNLIATGEQRSRVELAKLSNLSKMSVTNIVAELMEAGYVKEVEAEGPRTVGRNPIGLDISEKAPKIIGVLIKRSKCIVALCDLKMNILESDQHYWTICNAEILIETVCRMIDRFLLKEKNVVGIGVGTVGQVDITQGMILNPTNFFGIHHYPIGSFLAKRYGMPVHVDNQNNSAAIGELHYGYGKQYRDFVYVSITNGIGSGVVKNGENIHNEEGIGAEVGHISIDYKGPHCGCGNRGCLELYAGSNVICQKVWEETGERLEFEEICARSAEPYISGLLDDMMEKLAAGLLSLVNVLNPQAIILGQDAYYIPDHFLAQLEEMLNCRKLSKDFYHCQIVRPSLGPDGVLKGCAAMVADQMYQGEYLFRLEEEK